VIRDLPEQEPCRDSPRSHAQHDRAAEGPARVVLPHAGEKHPERERTTRVRRGEGDEALEHADAFGDCSHDGVDVARGQLQVAPVVGEALRDAPHALEHDGPIVDGWGPVRCGLDGLAEPVHGLLVDLEVGVHDARDECLARTLGDAGPHDFVQRLEPRPRVVDASGLGPEREGAAVLQHGALRLLEVFQHSGVLVRELGGLGVERNRAPEELLGPEQLTEDDRLNCIGCQLTGLRALVRRGLRVGGRGRAHERAEHWVVSLEGKLLCRKGVHPAGTQPEERPTDEPAAPMMHVPGGHGFDSEKDSRGSPEPAAGRAKTTISKLPTASLACQAMSAGGGNQPEWGA